LNALIEIGQAKNIVLKYHTNLTKLEWEGNHVFDYIKKFKTLTDKIISRKESLKFLNTVQKLKKLKKGQLIKLNIEVNKKYLKQNNKKGIF